MGDGKIEPETFDFKGIGITNLVSCEIRWLDYQVRALIEFGLYQTGAIITKEHISYPWDSYYPSVGKNNISERYYFGYMLAVGMEIRVNQKYAIPIRLSRYGQITGQKEGRKGLRISNYPLAVGFRFRIK